MKSWASIDLRNSSCCEVEVSPLPNGRNPKPETTVRARERLIQAARSLFAKHGFDRTSTIAIARAAGTSETQLLKKFESKEGLLNAIFEEDWAVLSEKLRGLDLSAPPAERLQRLVRAVVQHLDEDEDLKKLVAIEVGHVRRKPGNEVYLSRSYIESCVLVEGLFEEMGREGQLRYDLQPQTLRCCLFGMMSQMWRDQLRAPDVPAYSSDCILAMVEHFLRCFTKGEASAAAP